jgi:hypothetical protein
MDFEITPRVLLETLKRLFPHRTKLLKQGPLVTLTAAGKSLDVEGQFENVWSIDAVVHKPGRCSVDLIGLTKPLSLYDAKQPLRFQIIDGGLKFGTTRVKLHG